MAKRNLKPFGFGQGASKLPKLEVTISEHNFPLSQNVQQRSSPRDSAAELWGDDNEDDLLLQASQACEQNNLSALPDYSAWQQAPSTSTQINAASNDLKKLSAIDKKDHLSICKKNPSLSLKINSSFQFKAPGVVISKINTLKESDRGFSPLRDVSSNVKENCEDSFVMDNMRGDSEHFYKRLLQVQEENAKLKSENSKLLEQALSKDGEVTILRGRLKSSQAAVDGARLEKLQVGEKLHMEWAEKLAVISKEVGSLRTQLDCKDLEVIRLRERYKLLESNKIKLTQISSPQHGGTHASQRKKNDFAHDINGSFLALDKKNTLVTTSVQTDKFSKAIKLTAAYRSKTNNLALILPLLLETEAQQRSIFQDLYSDFSRNRYRNLDLSATGHIEEKLPTKEAFNLSSVYGELSVLSTVKDWNVLEETTVQRCLNIMSQLKSFLKDVLSELEAATLKVTTAFQRDLDDRYIQELSGYTPVCKEQLFSGKALFKDEQKIAARRCTVTLAEICCLCPSVRNVVREEEDGLVHLMSAITSHIASLSCAVQYSGLLLSFTHLISSVLTPHVSVADYVRLSSLAKLIVTSRPSPVVICQVLPVLRSLTLRECGVREFCTDNSSGNLKMDYDQGLVMFKKESCFMQVLLCQLETCIKCQEREEHFSSVVSLAQSLLSLYRNAAALQASWCQISDESNCKCAIRLAQVIVYTLQVCARVLHSALVDLPEGTSLREDLLAVCRCGVNIIYLWALQQCDLRLLDHYTGRCHTFVDLCNEMSDAICIGEIQGQVLSELLTTLQPSPEDIEMPSPASKQAWTNSFSRFHIAD